MPIVGVRLVEIKCNPNQDDSRTLPCQPNGNIAPIQTTDFPLIVSLSLSPDRIGLGETFIHPLRYLFQLNSCKNSILSNVSSYCSILAINNRD